MSFMKQSIISIPSRDSFFLGSYLLLVNSTTYLACEWVE